MEEIKNCINEEINQVSKDIKSAIDLKPPGEKLETNQEKFDIELDFFRANAELLKEKDRDENEEKKSLKKAMIVSNLISQVNTMVSYVQPTTSGIVTGIKPMIDWILNKLKNLLPSLKNLLNHIWQYLVPLTSLKNWSVSGNIHTGIPLFASSSFCLQLTFGK